MRPTFERIDEDVVVLAQTGRLIARGMVVIELETLGRRKAGKHSDYRGDNAAGWAVFLVNGCGQGYVHPCGVRKTRAEAVAYAQAIAEGRATAPTGDELQQVLDEQFHAAMRDGRHASDPVVPNIAVSAHADDCDPDARVLSCTRSARPCCMCNPCRACRGRD